MTYQRKQNIILDIDGTLWDTTEVVAAAWERAARQSGKNEVTVTAEKLKGLFGKPMDVIGRSLFDDLSEQEMESLLECCCEYEEEELRNTSLELLFPHVIDTIRTLSREQGRRLFIVSNCQSGYIELFIEKNRLEEYITDTECFGDTGLSKGENIRLVMERNGLMAEDTVYVGDIMGDYEASCEAGIEFIFAAYGFGDVNGVRRIEDFAELLEI